MSNVPPPGGFEPPPPPGGSFPPPPPPGGGFGTPPGAYGAGGGFAPSGAGAYSLEYAGFWQRFAASLLDGLIVAVFNIPAYAVDWSSDGSENAGLIALLNLAAFVAGLVYYAILEGQGATLGKQALGIRVIDIATGQPIGTGRAVGRYFGRILSSIPCGLGYIWMLWDDDKQTWHDKLVSSVVVRNP